MPHKKRLHQLLSWTKLKIQFTNTRVHVGQNQTAHTRWLPQKNCNCPTKCRVGQVPTKQNIRQKRKRNRKTLTLSRPIPRKIRPCVRPSDGITITACSHATFSCRPYKSTAPQNIPGPYPLPHASTFELIPIPRLLTWRSLLPQTFQRRCCYARATFSSHHRLRFCKGLLLPLTVPWPVAGAATCVQAPPAGSMKGPAQAWALSMALMTFLQQGSCCGFFCNNNGVANYGGERQCSTAAT